MEVRKTKVKSPTGIPTEGFGKKSENEGALNERTSLSKGGWGRSF